MAAISGSANVRVHITRKEPRDLGPNDCRYCYGSFEPGPINGPEELSHMYKIGDMMLWISVVDYSDSAPKPICPRCLQRAASEAEHFSAKEMLPYAASELEE
jgi:hypothetical protein